MAQSKLIARRRWNAPDSSEIALDALWDFHYRNEAGGVCRALPRAFLYAHIWCDHVSAGAFGHVCGAEPPPHDLLVCILRTDNAGAYEDLLSKIRR